MKGKFLVSILIIWKFHGVVLFNVKYHNYNMGIETSELIHYKKVWPIIHSIIL